VSNSDKLIRRRTLTMCLILAAAVREQGTVYSVLEINWPTGRGGHPLGWHHQQRGVYLEGRKVKASGGFFLQTCHRHQFAQTNLEYQMFRVLA